MNKKLLKKIKENGEISFLPEANYVIDLLKDGESFDSVKEKIDREIEDFKKSISTRMTIEQIYNESMFYYNVINVIEEIELL